MIVHAPGVEQPELILACDAADVREQSQLEVRSDNSPTFLCTKNTMKELANVGVCHIVFQSSLAGLFLVFKDTPPLKRWAIIDRP